MLLTVIIPAYNSESYLTELLNVLKPQLTKEVEVIIIDDGSKTPVKAPKWAKLIRQENKGASSARNAGLDIASGEYIAFIDADDLIADNYISTILNKIKTEQFDYCYMSWKTLPGGWQQTVQLKDINSEFPAFNLCVWNRIYKKDLIGAVRFNTKKLIAEDAEFIRKVQKPKAKKSVITDFMYFYRSGAEDSLTKRFANGQVDTKRIVYYFDKVTKDMKNLIKEFREADKEAEVILMTNQNDIPELSKYSMVIKPQAMKGTELRGERTSLFQKIDLPIKTQVVIYTSKTFAIGGIETWIYNFCYQMHKYYDITVLYDAIDTTQLERLLCIVPCLDRRTVKNIVCDTLIINRISDKEPKEVTYNRKIQMVHACKMVDTWEVPTDNDCTVCVSDAVSSSYDKLNNPNTIHNLTISDDIDKPLLLVSATRTSTFEKGSERMRDFAKLLDENGIQYLWLIFSDKTQTSTDKIIYMKPTLNIKRYIKMADYLVQLSDQEGFCYSIVEALELGTPVITTPIDVLSEIGFKDTENGYIVPFNISDDKSIKRILNVPNFTFKHDNKSIVNQWRKILGNTKPTKSYAPQEPVEVFITKTYSDTVLHTLIKTGQTITVPESRAKQLEAAGVGIIRGGNK